MAAEQNLSRRTKVYICGEELVLKGEESSEYLQRLARIVHNRMDKLRGMHPTLMRHRLAMLTAIYLADELEKARQENAELLQALKEAR